MQEKYEKIGFNDYLNKYLGCGALGFKVK